MDNLNFFNQLRTHSYETILHSENVGWLMMSFAEKLGLGDNYHDYFHAGVYHDIGKLNISADILHKPNRLTNIEYEIIKAHPILSHQMLIETEEFKNNQIMLDAALYHHERFCGGGYPFGLKGEEIPLAGRMGILVDVFEALSAKRSYKGGMPFDQIMDIMMVKDHEWFDPELARVFFDLDVLLEHYEIFNRRS